MEFRAGDEIEMPRTGTDIVNHSKDGMPDLSAVRCPLPYTVWVLALAPRLPGHKWPAQLKHLRWQYSSLKPLR